jgi:hypothetical protein
MSLLRLSSGIGWFIAIIAAYVFVVARLGLPASETIPVNESSIAGGTQTDIPPLAQPAPITEASLTVIISGVTCLVSTLGAFSTMFLAWRLDRRQSRETELRIAQLQIEVERARQAKAEQS